MQLDLPLFDTFRRTGRYRRSCGGARATDRGEPHRGPDRVRAHAARAPLHPARSTRRQPARHRAARRHPARGARIRRPAGTLDRPRARRVLQEHGSREWRTAARSGCAAAVRVGARTGRGQLTIAYGDRRVRRDRDDDVRAAIEADLRRLARQELVPRLHALAAQHGLRPGGCRSATSVRAGARARATATSPSTSGSCRCPRRCATTCCSTS